MEENQKKKHRRISIYFSSFLGCALFTALICLLCTIMSYEISKTVLYNRYKAQMTSIVDLAESYVDKDDMSECSKTLTESEKYKETRVFFDKFVSYYKDLHYLYIVKVMPEDSEVPIISICSANSDYEKQYEPEMVLHIGDGEADWYSKETTDKMRNITNGDKDVFFLQPSEWGVDYTLARPLIDSDGEHFALLCVDVDYDIIQLSLKRVSLYTALIVVLIGVFFSVAIYLWMRWFVTKPIKQLENSVTSFATKSHENYDLDELIYDKPKTHGCKEIEELSNAVDQMSNDMRNYVLGILEREKEVKDLHISMEEMDIVAHKDALTGVKNKTAYDEEAKRLTERIKKKENLEFAIVMIDVNDLKVINDRFGHDSGDTYIQGTCNIACDIFKHSPVFRVGGDEITIILKDEDYENRFELVEELKNRYLSLFKDASKQEYERFFAAVGLATFDKDVDEEVASVFRRADKEMYQNKAEMKNK